MMTDELRERVKAALSPHVSDDLPPYMRDAWLCDLADAAISAVMQDIEAPSEAMILSALKDAEIDGEVYHVEDFQLFVKSLIAQYRKDQTP